MKAIVTNIKYDTDSLEILLPKELSIVIPDDMEIGDIENFISDEVSNVTGFCHTGFSMTLSD